MVAFGFISNYLGQGVSCFCYFKCLDIHLLCLIILSW